MQVKKLCSFYPWLILSLIVGLVFYSEHIYLKLHLGKTYSPLTLNDQSPSFAVDETIFYATKTRAILNHHWFLGDPQIWEYQYKASPHLGEWLPAVILAGLSRLGGSLANGFMMADFVGPAVNFLVISLWLFYQTKQKAWAMVGGLTMMVLTYYLKYLPFVPSMIKIVIAGLTQGSFSPFIRSFHPQLTFPVLMLFLISAWKQRWWLSGILAGVLAYCHFFYFSFAVVFLAITSLQAILSRRLKLVKTLSLSWMALIIVSSGYFINLISFIRSGLALDFLSKISYRTNITATQLLVTGGSVLISFILIKQKRLARYWQAIGLTNLGLIIGSQLIKFSLDNPIEHWMIRTVYPLTTGLVLVVIGTRFKKIPLKLNLLILVLLLGYLGISQRQYFKINQQAFRLESSKVEVFNYLNQETPRDSVVLTASLKDNLYLSVYTHNNVFVPRAQLSLAPSAESLTRFLLANKIAGVSTERIKAMFSLTGQNQLLKEQNRFSFDDCAGVYLYFRQYAGADYYNCAVPEVVLKQILQQYQQIRPNLNQYRADYWLWGPYEQQWAQIIPDQLENLKLIWENTAYKLYAIKNN